MSGDRIVIIGAGQAGLQAALSLRQSGYDGALSLIGEEDHLPYQRPPLSKKYLTGEMTADRLLLKPSAFFDEFDVDLRLSVRAEALDPGRKTIELSTGETLGFSNVLLATGTRPRLLSLPGHGQEGVLTLRTINDVERMRPYLGSGGQVAIVGGGYIGLEVAAVTRSLGFEVTIFEAGDRVMQRVAAPETSAFFHDLHTRNGVAIRLNETIEVIEGNGRCTGVRTSRGEVFPAGLVLIAVGAVPETTLAEAAGLKVENGIWVDAACRTSADSVYAAGDCASFHSPLFDKVIRLESVQNAIDQARAAARAMMKDGSAYNPTPWFWSDQYDVKLQIAGLSQGHDRAEMRGSTEAKAFGIVYSKNGRLIAVDTVNQPKGHMLARRAIGGPVDAFDWQP